MLHVLQYVWESHQFVYHFLFGKVREYDSQFRVYFAIKLEEICFPSSVRQIRSDHLIESSAPKCSL